MASAAMRAKVMVPSLVGSSRLIICRKSSTGVSFLLLLLAGAVRGGGRGAGEGGVVDPAGGLPVVLVAEQGEVVDAGSAGDVVAGQGLGAGLGVGVPGDVVRGRGAGVLPAGPHRQDGEIEWVEDQLDAPPGQGGIDLVAVPCMDTVAVLVTVRHSDQRNA